MIDALLTLLQADTTLTALLPGGIYDGTAVLFISRQHTPGAFDTNKELRPCCLVKPTSSAPFGPYHTSSQDGVSLYLYQRGSSSTIESARNRIYTLLHRVRLAGVTGWELRHLTDSRGAYDDTIDAAMIVSRYNVYIRR